MDVSVILVNYNTLDLTRKAVESVIENTCGVEYEIIVVDNASTDGSLDFFSGCDGIRYIYNTDNIGFGRGNNKGLDIAKGKYVLLLNTDTYLVNNAIYEFYKYMETAPQSVACVGAVLYDKDMRINTSTVKYPRISKILLGSLLNILPFVHNKKNEGLVFNCPVDVEGVIGADMFIRRSVIQEIGFFDSNIFMYFEEIDLQKRMALNGNTIKLIDTPKIVHLEGQSSAKYSANRNIMFTRSVFYYLRKYNSSFKYYLFRVVYFLLKIPIVFNTHYSFGDRLKIIANNAM